MGSMRSEDEQKAGEIQVLVFGEAAAQHSISEQKGAVESRIMLVQHIASRG